jgi:hypothetical protein
MKIVSGGRNTWLFTNYNLKTRVKKKMSQWRLKATTFQQLQCIDVPEADLTHTFSLIAVNGLRGLKEKYLSDGFN